MFNRESGTKIVDKFAEIDGMANTDFLNGRLKNY
jgi:hypothetical protein